MQIWRRHLGRCLYIRCWVLFHFRRREESARLVKKAQSPPSQFEGGAPIARKLVAEEGGGFAEEEVELVVVDPVAGAGDLDQAAIGDGFVARVVLGKREKAFESPEEQRRAGDLAEELDGVLHVVAVGGDGAGVIVKFPKQRAVGLPVGAVQGKVARDFVGKARVGFLHAGHGGVGTWVTFRAALLELANGFDPFADALGGWTVYAMLLREAQPFNGDGFPDAGGIDTAITQNDAAAERMADEANGEIVDDVEERGEIEDVLGHTVGGAGRPGAVAVTAQIQGVDVIALAQDARNPIPVASMVQAAVDEDQGGLGVLAVVPELQLEAVGIEEMRNGFHGALSAIRCMTRLRKYTGLGGFASFARFSGKFAA